MIFNKVRRATVLLCAAMLTLLLSPIAKALTSEQASNLLLNLHATKVEAYLAINAYYNFSNSLGDKSLAGDANDSIQRIQGLVNQLQSAPGASALQAGLGDIPSDWKRYRELLETNIKDLIKQGYPDLRLTIEMSQANTDFVRKLGQIEDTVKKTANYRPHAQVELVRIATIRMEQMMSSYAGRSSSNVSQVAQGAEADDPLDVVAEQFSKQLDQLKQSQANTADTRKLLDGVLTKWNFIKKSYVNYNENNVSFVANLYSKRIVEDLIKLEKAYLAM
jgi:hypothetical protein